MFSRYALDYATVVLQKFSHESQSAFFQHTPEKRLMMMVRSVKRMQRLYNGASQVAVTLDCVVSYLITLNAFVARMATGQRENGRKGINP